MGKMERVRDVAQYREDQVAKHLANLDATILQKQQLLEQLDAYYTSYQTPRSRAFNLPTLMENQRQFCCIIASSIQAEQQQLDALHQQRQALYQQLLLRHREKESANKLIAKYQHAQQQKQAKMEQSEIEEFVLNAYLRGEKNG